MKLSLKRIFKNLLYILGIILLGVIVMYFIPLTPSSELVELSKESQKEYSDYTKNDSLIVLVDYSYPVFMKRFWVYNLKTDKVVLNTHVSHSWKSGLLFATQFSNTPGSNLSSTGVIRISEKYHGKYGPSLRLDGLETNNNKIRERAIVIHPMVDFRLYGITIPSEIALYSSGCFVLNNKIIERVRSLCHDGTLMVVVN